MRLLAHGLFRCLLKGQDQINISAGESKEAAVSFSLTFGTEYYILHWKNNVNLDLNAV